MMRNDEFNRCLLSGLTRISRPFLKDYCLDFFRKNKVNKPIRDELRLSHAHDGVTLDVDRDVWTAIFLVFIRQ